MSNERVEELAADLNDALENFYEPFDWHEATRIAGRLDAAGYRKPFVLSPGLYRNHLGAEIEVQSLEMARHIIGGIWNAYQKDDLFPSHLIVTAQGMQEAGYSRVEAS